jgi:LemA protein
LKGGAMAVWILISLIILFIAWIIFVFNRMITYKNDVAAAWSQIDVQLKRRHDLIPNLVSVVKGYMDFERETLERVISARTKAISAVKLRDKADAENTLTHSLGSLFAVIENYPVLKSNENVLRLQEELTTTENRIAFSRQFYNDLVANYRIRLEVFPDNIIASMFSFRSPDFFSAEKDDKILPSAKICR